MPRRTIQEIVSGNSPATGPARQGLSANVNAGLGRQLSRRVASGAITRQQAQRTAGERRLLEQRFGPNWRVKIYGDRGYEQRTRQALASGSPNPNAKALQERLLALRANAVARARQSQGAKLGARFTGRR